VPGVEALATPSVRLFIIPAVATFLGIWIKRVSSPDQSRSFQRDDWAIGPSLAVTGLFIYFTFLINAIVERRSIMSSNISFTPPVAKQIDVLSRTIEDSIFFLPAFVLLIVGMVGITRRHGHEKDGGTEGRKYTVPWGTLVPDLAGLVALYGAYVLTS